MAAERRLLASRGEAMTPTQDPEEDDIGIEVEEFRETDKDRHQTMMTSMDSSEANELRTGTLSDFWGDFILPKCSTRGGYGTGDNTTGTKHHLVADHKELRVPQPPRVRRQHP